MARWHSCNVLHVGANTRQIWQFDARNGDFKLHREQLTRAGEPLPAGIVGKSWRSLVQRKLNVAWLPPEHVFFRVAQFPQSTPEETRAMVDLQLEKLSPIPVAQALWTMHVLPGTVSQVSAAAGEGGPRTVQMQTVVVTIVARNIVEEFLDELEGQGYMADRVELPLLDELLALSVKADGAWILPESHGARQQALVAWWYGGVLQNIGLLTLPEGPDRAGGVRDQLLQMAWAGELEGWLTSPPSWHLVDEGERASVWHPVLREALGQPVEMVRPLPGPELAARTARRVTQADESTTLLPTEFVTRYQQRFYDRLWMRGLAALGVCYCVGVVIYFVALFVLNYKTTRVQTQAAALGPAYTNVVQLKQRVQILSDRQELKYAGLDCWKAVAELMPSGMSLDLMRFSNGKTLSLNGTGTDANEIYDFGDKLRRASPTPTQKPLFDATGSDVPVIRQAGPNAPVTWSYELNLKRTEAL
jgi:hypothetical protein